MGYRDFPCAINNAHVNELHDLQHADVPRAEAVEQITNVFRGTESEAFGMDREHLVEAFRSMFVDAEDRRIEYLMLALLQPDRYAYLAEQMSDWAKGHARAVANGEVRV